MSFYLRQVESVELELFLGINSFIKNGTKIKICNNLSIQRVAWRKLNVKRTK